MRDDPTSWSYGQTTINRHDPRKGGGVESKTGRLGPAPDDHSGPDGHSNCKQKWNGPAPPAGNRDQSEAVAGIPVPAAANQGQRKGRRHEREYPDIRAIRQWDPSHHREDHTGAGQRGPCHHYPRHPVTAAGEDILAWTENAISRVEDTARYATQEPWRSHDTHLDHGGHTATILAGEDNNTELLAWLPTMSHEAWDEARNAWRNANHIVMHAPTSVLRRCAADRQLLDLHGGSMHSCPAKDETGYLDEWTQFGYGDTCPVVQTIAEGYGWTEGERC